MRSCAPVKLVALVGPGASARVVLVWNLSIILDSCASGLHSYTSRATDGQHQRTNRAFGNGRVLSPPSYSRLLRSLSCHHMALSTVPHSVVSLQEGTIEAVAGLVDASVVITA
jgi:hypothetical protein